MLSGRRLLKAPRGRRRLSSDWGRSWGERRTCKELVGWSRCREEPSRTPAAGFCESAFGIIDQITCMLSMSSPLSQKIVDNFTFLISFSCNLCHGPSPLLGTIYLFGFVPHTCSMVNEEGHPEFSYQYLSPNLCAAKFKRSETASWFNGEPEVVELPADDARECGTDLITW